MNAKVLIGVGFVISDAMVARYGDAWFTGEAFGQSTDGYIRMLIAWQNTPEGAEWMESFRRASGIGR